MFYYGQAGQVPDTLTGITLAGHIGTMFQDLCNFLWHGWSLYEVETKRWDVDAQYWSPLSNTVISTVQGEQSGDMSSFQTAILIGAKTAVKAARGRKFIAGAAELYTLDGAITGELIVAVAAFLVSYLSAVPVSGRGTWVPGIVSKNSIFAPFISGWFGNILSTMRRRKPGYGI
jgi:hypothetical protein